MNLEEIQKKVDSISIFHIKKLHNFEGIPKEWRPWEAKLSPSAMYNCGLPYRKKSGIKTVEVKWMSIKRWLSTTPGGIRLPDGVYLSIKRIEKFVAEPTPHLDKIEFNLIMFPYGNVWSQIAEGVPITEEWLFSNGINGKLMLENLMTRDALNPIKGYYKACYEFITNNKDQAGIHLKRKRSNEDAPKTKIVYVM
jgi:hypothetical protein